jgi:DNA-binding HxlR family transcriptional regulator
MLNREYPTQYCSIASTLEIIGERWTILVLRDIFLGTRRFEDLQRHLGVARNILQVRLERLVDHGILVKRPYQDRPVRSEYRLTEKGADLWPVLVSLLKWGDRYALDGERPSAASTWPCTPPWPCAPGLSGAEQRRPPRPEHGARPGLSTAAAAWLP